MTVKDRDSKKRKKRKPVKNDIKSKTEWAARLLGHAKHSYLYDKSPPSDDSPEKV